ncbi:MAG: hypothetical protein GX647_12880 [Clostridiales bacterium]|nr:hypothetical protein [Clostridiales bacterium]
MKFLHISDTHFLRDAEDAKGSLRDVLVRMTPPLEQLDKLLEAAGGPFDFVLHTGDLCDGGSAGDYRALREGLERRFPGAPIHAVPGNHDREGAWRDGWGEDFFRVKAARFGELAIVLLNSSDPKHPDGRIREADCDLLERALAEIGGRPSILLLHHHLIPGQFTLPTAVYPERFRRIVAESNLLALFNGHTHHAHAGAFAGKPCYTAGSLSFRGTNRETAVAFDEFAAINRCRFGPEGLFVEAISQGAKPRPLADIALPIRT